jgi:hypothetical protein
MPWKKLIFKQNQPIHVGFGKWGVVKETAIFIPGQTMWGALTNFYAQEFLHLDNTNIENAGSFFEKISNFFPSFDGKKILEPHYQNGEFHLGEFSEREFRAYFVDTFVQTAIEPLSRKAKDESLHEIDFILQKPKKEFQALKKLKDLNENLYWIGIIFLDAKKIRILNEFLKRGLKIYIGSDVRYGLGELELVKIVDLTEEDKEFWWIQNEKIEIKSNLPSPYFLELRNNITFEGEYLLIPEFDFTENTPKIKNAKFYSHVGSKLQKKETLINSELHKGKLIFST